MVLKENQSINHCLIQLRFPYNHIKLSIWAISTQFMGWKLISPALSIDESWFAVFIAFTATILW